MNKSNFHSYSILSHSIFTHTIIYLVLNLTTIVASSGYRYVIHDTLTHLPCDHKFSSGILHPGSTRLTPSGPTTIQDVSIGGWMLLRGFLDQYYTIFSFHETTPSPLTLIYSVSYSPKSLQIQHRIYSDPPVDIPFPLLATNQWVFILAYINFDTSLIQTTAGTQIWSYRNENPSLNPSNLFQQLLSNNSIRSTAFTKSSLLFNTGNSNQAFLPQINPACSYTRFLTINSQSGLSNLMSSLYDPQAAYNNLQFHLEGFYTNYNRGLMFSLDPSENGHATIPTSISDPFTSFQAFQTDYINPSKDFGFTLQFAFKTAAAPPQNLRIVSLIENQFYLATQLGTQLQLSTATITGVSFSTWVEIIIIVQQGIQGKLMLIARAYENQIQTIDFPLLRVLRLRFGHQPNPEVFSINSIRVYSGIYLTDNTQSPFQLPISSTMIAHALICASTLLIDFQHNAQCVTVGSPPDFDPSYDFQKSWNPNRILCLDPGQIHDQSGSGCRCRKQHYFNIISSTCEPCSRFCNGCSLKDSCLDQDTNRVSETCTSPSFDDGYNCKDPQQLLETSAIRSSTIIEYFNLPTYISNILQPFSKVFSGVPTKGSILFTFSYEPSTSFSYTNNAIATVTCNTIELITLVLNSVGNELQMHLYIEGILAQQELIHPATPTWFAVWTDFSDTVVSIFSNGFLTQQTAGQLISSPTASDSEICIGSCPTLSTGATSISLGGLHHRPYILVTNTLDPRNYIEQNSILQLLLEEAAIVFLSSLELKQYTSYYLHAYPSIQPYSKLLLDFAHSRVNVFEQLKGFGFDDQSVTAKIQFEKQSHVLPPSFSTSIFIRKMKSMMSLLSFQFSNTLCIEYFLLPLEESRNAALRICLGSECQDATKALLNMFEANFFAILTMDMTPFSIELLKLVFHIVCNYSSERITFLIPRISLEQQQLQTFNLMTQSEEANPYSIFLNRIMFIKGNSYYFEDLNDSNACFLSLKYTNAATGQNPICIQPHRGHVILSEEAIRESNCINSSLNIRFVNSFTRECIDSNILRSECEAIDESTLSCLTCKPGYFQFYSNGRTICLPCDQNCATCISSSSNCLSCKDSILAQSPPTCECIEKDYFWNASYICEKCHSHCGTCFGISTNCLTCAENRVNPPTCSCNQSSTISNIITQECEPLICESQCLTCSGTPSNCTTCSNALFTPPPACKCASNQTSSNGACMSCLTGQFFSSYHSKCFECKLPCIECETSATNCITCSEGLRYMKSNCMCEGESNSIRIQKTNGEFTCAKEVEITFSLEVDANSKYTLTFTFEIELRDIDFTKYPISELLSLTLIDIPSQSFALENARVNSNIFLVDLIVKKEFKTTFGYVVFLQNIPFLSIEEEKILSHIYLETPFLIRDIGPLFFSNTQSSIADFNGISNSIESTVGSKTIDLVQNLQLAIYFFGSLQSSALFLQLSINYPPNLYSFLQLIGLTVYPNVVNYQTVQQAPAIISNALFENLQSESCNDFVLKRLGISISALVNIPLVIIKYNVVLLILVSLEFLKLRIRSKVSLWNTTYLFIIKQLINENDVNLIASWISIFANLSNINSESWTSRYGFYCGILIIIINVYIMYSLYRGIARKNPENSPFEDALISNLKKKRSSSSKSFFFVQLILKYCIVFVLFFARDFQYFACLICSGCYLLSGILTIRMRPYRFIRSRIIGIITDFIFAISWVMVMAIFNVESRILSSQDSLLDYNLSQAYATLGEIVLILLATANFIYIIEKIFTIKDQISEVISKRKSNAGGKENEQVEKEFVIVSEELGDSLGQTNRNPHTTRYQQYSQFQIFKKQSHDTTIQEEGTNVAQINSLDS